MFCKRRCRVVIMTESEKWRFDFERELDGFLQALCRADFVMGTANRDDCFFLHPVFVRVSVIVLVVVSLAPLRF